MKSDVFISHASEDKEKIARPLADRLRSLGYRVWFDESVLKLGDKLRQEIDRGLAQCRFGVVILSPSFFAKHFPRDELDGLAARETADGRKVILPLWHEISHDGVAKHSPMLAGRLAKSTAGCIEPVVTAITDVLGPPYDTEHPDKATSSDDTPQAAAAGASAGTTSIAGAKDAADAYERANQILGQKNLTRWNRFSESTSRAVTSGVLELRRDLDSKPFDPKVLAAACREIVSIMGPSVILALCAIESEVPTLMDQRGLIADLLHVRGWNSAGVVVVTQLPEVAAAAAHHILGAFLLQARRAMEATALLLTPIHNDRYGDSTELWRSHQIMSYVKPLGGKNDQVLPFVLSLYDSEKWLTNFFETAETFAEYVRAYLLLGSIVELADFVRQKGKLDGNVSFDVAPMFLHPPPDGAGLRRMISRALPDSAALKYICTQSGVHLDEVRNAWPDWLNAMHRWFRGAGHHHWTPQLLYGNVIPKLP